MKKKLRFFVGIGAGHAFYEDKSGDFWGFGKNMVNQLGIQREKSFKFPRIQNKPTKTLTHFKGRIKNISTGHSHTIVHTINNRLYSIGFNGFGALGIGDTHDRTKFVEIQHKIFSKFRIKKVCSGYFHTVILLEDGNVYACGRGANGECGCGKQRRSFSIPQKMKLEQIFKEGEKIVEVQCGNIFTLLISNLNNIFKTGIICESSDEKTLVPTRIIGFIDNESIYKVGCGLNHLILLGTSGTVYGLGQNNYNQISKYLNTQNMNVPVYKLPYIQSHEIEDVKCSQFRTIFLKKNGSVIALGCEKSILGKKNNLINKKHGIFKIGNDKNKNKIKIHQIECGRLSNFLFPKEENFTWVFGDNYNGLGLKGKRYTTIMKKNIFIKDIQVHDHIDKIFINLRRILKKKRNELVFWNVLIFHKFGE